MKDLANDDKTAARDREQEQAQKPPENDDDGTFELIDLLRAHQRNLDAQRPPAPGFRPRRHD